MIRKFGFWVLLVLFLIGIVVGYFYFINARKNKIDVLSYIPADCNVLIESNGYSELVKQIDFDKKNSDQFLQLKFIKESFGSLVLIDSLAAIEASLSEVLSGNPLYVVGSRMGGLTEFAMIVSTPTQNFGEFLKNIKSRCKNVKRLLVQNSNNEYWNFDFGTIHRPVFFSEQQGVLFFSFSQRLMEKLLMRRSPLSKDSCFLKLYASLAKPKTVRCFFNLNQQHELSDGLLSVGQTTQQLLVGKSGNWMVADFDAKPGCLDFSGYLESDSCSILNLLKKQEPQLISFPDYIPEQTVSFISFGFSDYYAFRSGLKEKANIRPLKNRQLTESKVITNLSGEMAITDVVYGDSVKYQYSLFKIKNRDECRNELKLLSDSVTAFRSDSILSLDSDSVYHFSNSDWVKVLSSGLFNFSFPYCFFSSDYLLFAQDKNSIKLFNESVKKGKVLQKSQRYMETMKANLNDASNFFFYSCVYDSLNDGLTKNVTQPVKEKIKSFQNLSSAKYSFGFQILAYKERLILQGSLIRNEFLIEDTPRPIWTTQLDTLVVAGPYVVINHKTLQNEFVIQDAAGQMYLIDNSGKLMWKKKLDGVIISKIHQVDCYKNGKLQMLFNTNGKIYLLDRNGKDTKDFPLALNPSATNGLSVFDYENDKDYRMAYFDTSNELKLLQLSGKPVQGFDHFRLSDTVSVPIEWIRLNNKDYLIVRDRKGLITIVNRRGERKFTSPTPFCNTESPITIERNVDLSTCSFFYYQSSSKEILKNSVNGMTSSVKLSTDFESPYFSFLKINEDEIPDLVMIEENKIEVYDGLGDLLAGIECQDKLKRNFSVIKRNGECICAVVNETDELLLIPMNWKKVLSTGIKCSGSPLSISDGTFLAFFQNELACYSY